MGQVFLKRPGTPIFLTRTEKETKIFSKFHKSKNYVIPAMQRSWMIM